ncbi:hypothetical protein M409DRAFT_20731 [Zasmidium cellare ATCC 36951]|uniref:DUF7730 domain-containing protein n=1 Tax=Zasmidium cellare ATCC 36951 TaxID=1080233 RepID=A0A6A6CNL4_ZASCE|nr:uncharacterized protein M409DRAFT_20731 [Zasmidium cellare ATCC 36951]KAF2168714.1 hypothetical protein M409DRAFT_20731 [Zasmidium cellare ATCC 36951]
MGVSSTKRRAKVLRIVMPKRSATSSAAVSLPEGPHCWFFAKLPAEFREKIYVEVFRSFPTLLLQRKRQKKHKPNTIQCTVPIGRRQRDKTSPNWSKSNTGILLASKACYNEASKCLYGNLSIVFDKPFSINYAFLRTVTAPSLACIKRITIQHRTTLLGRGGGNTQQATKNEASETVMWARIVSCMTGLDSPHIKLSVQQYHNHIVPSFDDDWGRGDPDTFYSVNQLNSIHWLQPLRTFCALQPQLKKVRVDSWDEPHHHMRATTFMGYRYDKAVYSLPGQTYENAHDEVRGKWCCFYKALHASMGRAIRDIILGKEEPWAEHLVVLTKYEMFRLDQHGSTGLFKDDAEEARAMRREID